VGWQKNSAVPGQVGNVVLTGHNNIEGSVFRNLDAFQDGDAITLYAGGRTFDYYVTDKFVVQEAGVPYSQQLANAKWIGTFPDARLTLVSCYPPTGNTERIFIIARPKG
jgi:sortase A